MAAGSARLSAGLDRDRWLDPLMSDDDAAAVHAAVLGGGRYGQLHRYGTDEVRISISWKAYCFEDEAAVSAFDAARGSLTIEEIESRLLADLHHRGLLDADDRESGPSPR